MLLTDSLHFVRYDVQDAGGVGDAHAPQLARMLARADKVRLSDSIQVPSARGLCFVGAFERLGELKC
jgi:hypothetical protein